jgi:hypothetical protein
LIRVSSKRAGKTNDYTTINNRTAANLTLNNDKKLDRTTISDEVATSADRVSEQAN